MTILIVEDNEAKCKQIGAFLRSDFPGVSYDERHSYNTGLSTIIQARPSVILLDMSMPTFDSQGARGGGRKRLYAGRDVLYELQRREIETRAIIVTQFETFGEGAQRRSLDELNDELAGEFPGIYLGTVYYYPSQSAWKRELTRLLRRAGIKPSGAGR